MKDCTKRQHAEQGTSWNDFQLDRVSVAAGYLVAQLSQDHGSGVAESVCFVENAAVSDLGLAGTERSCIEPINGGSALDILLQERSKKT